MEKEDIMLVAQLLSSSKEAIFRLEEAYRKKDIERVSAAKKEILHLQQQISGILK